jgi:S-phase kinase-associated protein 1
MTTISKDSAVKIVSSDNHLFTTSLEVAIVSETIKNLIEDSGIDETIPVPNVSGKILARTIKYITFHNTHDFERFSKENGVSDTSPSSESAAVTNSDTNENSEKVKQFDIDFVNVDQSTLFDLILAANYLNIKSLLDLTCKTVAGMIKGKTPEEIRKQFNIKNDFTPEEEEEVRRENQWAFD